MGQPRRGVRASERERVRERRGETKGWEKEGKTESAVGGGTVVVVWFLVFLLHSRVLEYLSTHSLVPKGQHTLAGHWLPSVSVPPPGELGPRSPFLPWPRGSPVFHINTQIPWHSRLARIYRDHGRIPGPPPFPSHLFAVALPLLPPPPPRPRLYPCVPSPLLAQQHR